MSPEPQTEAPPGQPGRKGRNVQYGALAWRDTGDGKEVLLVTSRDTGRWVIPKGWPMKNRTPWDAAAREAFEEAGVKGQVEQVATGAFSYLKRLSRWRERMVEVKVFRLEVERELEDWPERRQRQRAWLSPAEAAARVDEPDLAEIIRAL